MDLSRELFTILFLGILALASGVQIGLGVYRLRRREWTDGSFLIARGLLIVLIMVFLGDQRFLPPSTSVFALAVVGLIFVGSILAQVWFVPRLNEDFGDETVSALSWGGAFILVGLGVGLFGYLQNNPATGICGGGFLVVLGVLWLVPGVRGAVRQAFGRTAKPKPPEEKTKRARRQEKERPL